MGILQNLHDVQRQSVGIQPPRNWHPTDESEINKQEVSGGFHAETTG